MDIHNESLDSLVNPENVRRLRRALTTGELGGPFMPAVYIVEPTNRCNLQCIMCPNSRLGPERTGDASLDDLSTAFQQISPYAELTMLYFMGESTLHGEFVDMLRMARQALSGKIVLSTNGSSLSDAQMAAILSCVDILIVPIDRWNVSYYERIRRGSKFASVVDLVERILELRGREERPVVLVKGLDLHLPSENLDELSVQDEARRFVDYWEGRGAKPLVGWLNSWAGQIPGLLKLTSSGSPYVLSERLPCADLWFKMVINWRGHVVLCCHNWNSSVDWGSLRSASIAEIWNSSIAREYRASHVARDWSVGPICGRCREWAEPSELESYLRLGDDDLFRIF